MYIIITPVGVLMKPTKHKNTQSVIFFVNRLGIVLSNVHLELIPQPELL